jgi:hypothetical protein
MSFLDDLLEGVAVEQKVLAKIKEKHPSATLINAYKGYDIWIPETSQGIEVKYDPMSNKTGNIVVEIEMNGKKSALTTTTADYWVFYDDNVFAWFKPMDIIYCIFVNKLRCVDFIGEGDSSSKRAFLINKEILFSHAIKIVNKD